MTEPPDEFVEFARAAFEHRNCLAKADQLADVLPSDRLRRATTEPHSGNGVSSWLCPHGVRYWLVPADGQS